MNEEKTIKEHIKDLKKGFYLIGILSVLAFIIFFYSSSLIVSVLLNYLNIPMENVIALTPFENLQTKINIATGLTIVFLFPLVYIALYNFSKPAMDEKTIKDLRKPILASFFLALFGIAFGVFIFSKATLFILMNTYSLANPMWSIKSVINYITISSITSAVIIQVVVLIPTLNSIGIIQVKHLKKYRLWALVGALIISAMVTPPDVVSYILMGGFLYGGFELGILFSRKKEVEI